MKHPQRTRFLLRSAGVACAVGRFILNCRRARPTVRMTILLMAPIMLMLASYSAEGQQTGNRMTCTGTLVDVWLKPKDRWPLAVIFDEAGNYTCSIDRGSAGHDPLKPCAAGERCRITGSTRKHEGYAGKDPTFSIQLLDSVERIGEQR
jgi:hypothetical protein